METGISQRPSKVVHDRKGSAVSEAEIDDFDWKEILKDAIWFHFTGITPAMSDKAALVTLDACKTARVMGITISAVINYRKKLWSPDKALKVISELMQYVDVIIGNKEDTEKVFRIKATESDVIKGNINLEGYKKYQKNC